MGLALVFGESVGLSSNKLGACAIGAADIWGFIGLQPTVNIKTKKLKLIRNNNLEHQDVTLGSAV